MSNLMRHDSLPRVDGVNLQFPPQTPREDPAEEQWFPQQPFIVGERLTRGTFEALAWNIRRLAGKGLGATVAIREEDFADDALAAVLPIVRLERAYGTETMYLRDASLGEGEVPWHTDYGEHNWRRYILTTKEGQTTQFVNNPSYYYDKDGEPIDHTQRYGVRSYEVPTLEVIEDDIWQPPAFIFTGFFGDTLHSKTPTSRQRRTITMDVLPLPPQF